MDIVDSSLVPPPLSVRKSRRSVELKPLEEDLPPASRFSSTSSSSDSITMYPGVIDVVTRMMRKRMNRTPSPEAKTMRARRRAERQAESLERDDVMSSASAKYPGMIDSDSQNKTDLRFSWTSDRRAGIQQGVSDLCDKLRSFSISDPTEQNKRREDEQNHGRRRQKQLAIPPSPYQKYGAAIWGAELKETKRPRRAQHAAGLAQSSKKTSASQPNKAKKLEKIYPHRRSAPPQSIDLMKAFQSGRRQIIKSLDDTKHRLRRSASERRREALKKSITLVGPTDPYTAAAVHPAGLC